MITIEQLLQAMLQQGASDLHLKAGSPPVLRIHGRLAPQPDCPHPDEAVMTDLLSQLTTETQQETFAHNQELDFAYSLSQEARFRVNVAYQKGSIGLTLRAIRTHIPSLSVLGLPDICAQLSLRSQGLVLITGPTGCGKSTTLAAMIEHINTTAARRIVTIEDPIEYVFQDRQSVITQREIGIDTPNFASALKHVLRQDPDVIMVGEMRDLETVAATLTAAETGHLVLATLHTPSAPEAVDRIIDVFPAHQQTQVRAQLSMTLAGVLAQRLVLRADGNGRIAACEVMIGSTAVRNLIREGKTAQMTSMIQTGRDQGMQTLDQALQDLYRRRLITREQALMHVKDPNHFK